MLGKVYSGALSGVDGVLVCVEADAGNGLPQFDMIGMLEKSVTEARERVRTALKNTGYLLPAGRYTINLSPADLKKHGNAFDISIAVAVLIATGDVVQEKTDGVFMLGELSLDGKIRPVDGVLPLVMMAAEMGFKSVIVPYENGNEASIASGIDVYPFTDLREVIDFLDNRNARAPLKNDAGKVLEEAMHKSGYDMADINGQILAKRATTVAAAGRHNILYIGPPGSGKTMLAKRFPSILPDLTLDEALEITKLHSICGLLPRDKALICERPFRNPHHTTSMQALVGGGRIPKPGEVTLAHKGILFLDELPEFNKQTLEVLRQPLEDREVVLSRVQASYHFPADCQLVAAMNPCSCGYYPDRSRCHCSPADVARYLGRISRPLLDRIDLCVEVARIGYDDLERKETNESSADIRSKVIKAVEIQRERYKKENIMYNSQLTPGLIRKYCKLGDTEKKLLKDAFDRLNLSARAYHRMIKVSRTIADLEGSERITEDHICEAIGYRTFDREVWR